MHISWRYVTHINLFKLFFRRSNQHRSALLLTAMVRADKNKRAAEHQFTKFYDGEVWSMNRRWYRCNLDDSQLSEARTRSPHNLLYFLLNVLRRLVDDFWKTMESSETYVKMCVATMNKCPPSIIGLLVYLKAPSLPPTV